MESSSQGGARDALLPKLKKDSTKSTGERRAGKLASGVRRRAGGKGLFTQYLARGLSYCPGNKQSGGKRLSGASTSGNPHLRAILSEVACNIARSKEANYLTALYHRIARRRGKQRALLAVAHSLLVCIYYVIRDQKVYQDLGADYFDKLDTARIERHHIRRLEQLGYVVTLAPKETA